MILYGRDPGAWSAERFAVERSVRRLIAKRMIFANDCGWCRLTKKGRAWLRAADRAAHKLREAERVAEEERQKLHARLAREVGLSADVPAGMLADLLEERGY